MGWQKKTRLLEKFNLKSDWPVFGKPEQIHTDSGKDFRAKLVDIGCQKNGIWVMRSPVKRPEYKGHVERFFGTLNTELIHNLRGTTFSNIAQKGEYDSTNEASLTLDQLETLVIKFIVDQYHNSRHSAIGCTPLEKWKRGVESMLFKPKEPEDLEQLRLDFLSHVDPDGKRTIGKDGVHFKERTYFHPDLNFLPKEESQGRPKRYSVRYDPFDLRSVYLLDDVNNRLLQVPETSFQPKAFTLKELEAANRKVKFEQSGLTSQEVVMETINERREQLNEQAQLHAKSARQLAAHRRIREVLKRSGQKTDEESETLPVVEDYSPQIDEVLKKQVRLSL